MREDLGIAGIGCLAAEDGGRAFRAAEDFVHQRELDLAVTLAAEFGSEVTRPQPALLHFCLKRRNQLGAVRIGEVVRMADDEIERLDFFGDERVDPVEFALELRLSFE